MILIVFWSSISLGDWEIDLSRRTKDLKKQDINLPEKIQLAEPPLISGIASSSPKMELVIMNTAKGFVPDTLRLQKDRQYTIHIVNVNPKAKNVSFILDDFAEHHGTYYAKPKSFKIYPQQAGIFRFQSPEVAHEGQIVIMGEQDEMMLRNPASILDN